MAGERELMQRYFERTRAELADLAARGFLLAGSAFAPVLFVKGAPNAAERAGEPLLSGADGQALAAALGRLGYGGQDWAACSSLVRGEDGGFADAAPFDLACAVEALGPELVIALDAPAARALQGAWGLAGALPEGDVARVRGRRVLALGGFEDALADPRAKQLMWARLKRVPPLGAPL